MIRNVLLVLAAAATLVANAEEANNAAQLESVAKGVQSRNSVSVNEQRNLLDDDGDDGGGDSYFDATELKNRPTCG